MCIIIRLKVSRPNSMEPSLHDTHSTNQLCNSLMHAPPLLAVLTDSISDMAEMYALYHCKAPCESSARQAAFSTGHRCTRLPA